MAVGKKPIFSSTTAVLFTFIYTLSVFCGHRTSCDILPESSLKSRRDGRSIGNMQMESLSSTIAADGSDGRIISTQSGVLFDPPVLDFEEQNVGMPRLETVHIFNPSQSHPLHLNSISGDSPIFHASFFRSKVLKAGESTTFDVIFLARVSEEVHTSLYIQTSLGTFDYKVQGVGVPNQFRLRSLLGARIPLNATYSPFITMFNPYNTSLQVTEMYSSGGDLHLELLTGQNQGFKSLWEIRPFETKAIGRANYFGRMITNHTSFVRIKTSHESSPSIVLPVEVEVAVSSGLFLSREILDFGVLKSGESKALPLYILNAGSHVVNLEPIKILPENEAIEIEFMSVVLKPGSKYTKVAAVTFYSDRVKHVNQTSGILVIRGHGDVPHKLEVPFESHVLRGSLSYDKAKTLFRAGHPPTEPVVHRIPLANQFEVPVVIYDVKLPSKAQEYFSITSFDGPYVLPPDSKWHHPFSVTFAPPTEECLFNTTLRLATNSTYFTIPIFCYDGRVTYSSEGSDVAGGLDYGVLSESNVASKIVTIHNVNPVKIQITGYSLTSGLPHATIELGAIHPTNSTPPTTSSLPPKPPLIVDASHSASFQVNITKPKSSGKFSGEIVIHTSFERVFRIPVFYNTIIGRLRVKPKVISFQPAFPFGVSEVALYVENLFQRPVKVESLRREPRDPRFFIRKVVDDREVNYPEVQPNELIQIGTAVFDPLLEAGSESVYLGMGDRVVWNRTYSSSPQVPVGKPKQSDPVADLQQFSQLWKAWNSLIEDGGNVLNFSYVLTPSSGAEVSIPATATLTWPRVLDVPEGNIVKFPSTTIGSFSVWKMNVTNPSYRPLMVQPVLLQHYNRFQTIIDLLAEQLDPDLHNLDFSPSLTSSFAFSSSNGESSLASMVIRPNSSHQIAISFSPKMHSLANTLLLIRNNLTVFDYVLLQGQGIRGVFSINGVQPSSESLLFEFTQAMMEQCQAGPMVEPMKLSRVFLMHNSGSTPLTLYLVGIGTGGKEEDGFTITNYKREIIIKPNKTKTIEISFAPDFTISRLSSTLSFKTSSGTELLYPLLAVIPHHLLAICYAMQPRPEWEQTLAWLSVPFWLCVLVALVAIALVQTKFGMTPELSYQNDPALPVLQATGGAVFDLRNVDTSRRRTNLPTADSSAEANGQVPETLSPHSRSHTPSSSPSLSRQRPTASSAGHRDHSPLSTTVKHGSTAPSSSTKKDVDHLPMAVVHAVPQQRLQVHSNEQKVKEIAVTQTSSTTSTQNASTDSTLATAKGNAYQRCRDVARTPSLDVHAEEVNGEDDNKKDETSSQSTEEHSPSPSAETVAVQTELDSEQLITVVVKLKKPSDLEVLEDKVFESSEPSDSPMLESTFETVSPTTGVYTAPHSKKQQKAPRKPASKGGQKTSQQSAESTPPPLPVPLPFMHRDLRRDHLVRKESESSMKSGDSESTTSSGDKSDEKDLAELASPQSPVSEHGFLKSESGADLDSLESPLEQKALPCKEPNTGQTILATEDVEIILSEEVMRRERGKTKRKQRQLKKEEKARRKEKERATAMKAKDKQQQSASMEELAGPAHNSETNVTAISERSSGNKRVAPVKSDSSVLSKTKAKLAASTSTEKSDGDTSRRTKDSVELSSSKTNQLLSHPAPSVPSTAIKSSRGGPTKLKEIMLDPFSRNPDRSTYASKKTTSKKSSSDKFSKSPSEEPKEDMEVGTDNKTEFAEIENFIDDEECEWINADGEDGDDTVVSDGAAGGPSSSSSGGKDQQQSVPSPHDLAASVLSTMKIKKAQNSPAKSTDSVDYDEEEGELVKANAAHSDESLRHSRPSTISPTKDDSLSSPSPPLPQKPSTLSLDAQPFYPSSNFKAAKKQGKSTHRSKGKSRTGEGKAAAEPSNPEAKVKKPIPQFTGRSFPSDNSPHAISPADAAMLEQAEYFQPQPDRHSPPSPTYNMPFRPEPRRYAEPFYDGPEPPGAFRRVPERDIRPYYGMEEPGFQHMERMPQDIDPYLAAKIHHNMGPHARMPPMNPYPQQQKVQQPHPPPMSAYLPPPPGYEGPPMLPHVQVEDDYKRQQILMRKRQYLLDLYRQERAALAAAYAREQARKSAEALNSLHRPTPMSSYPHESSKHPLPGNLWEEYRECEPDSHMKPPYSTSPDDIDPHLLPARSRTMSSGSDIGGEILSGYQHLAPSSSSVGPPGYKRAPGAEYTRMDQNQASVEEETFNSEKQEKASAIAWSPTASEEPSVDWENKMDTKWYSSGSNSIEEGFSRPPNTTSYSGIDNPSESSQQFIGNTYELFENQSIWSLNNSGSESSNLLSWALLGAEQNKNSSDQ